MTCLGRGEACLGELESAGGTTELFFAAAVVGRTERLADEEVCAAAIFLPPSLSCGFWIGALDAFGMPNCGRKRNG